MSLPLVYPAPAKVNLFLNLLGCRPDAYHDVRMLMQTIALSDELSITVGPPGLDMTFTCSEEPLVHPDNLVVKAYTLFYRPFHT